MTLLLDNEAVQALRDETHPKHRHALAHLEANVARRRRGRQEPVVVPTTVRVEAGWNRTDPRAATINRLRAADVPLDATLANLAADIATTSGVSVADAHLGAAARSRPGDIVILTSDPGDMHRAAAARRIIAIRL